MADQNWTSSRVSRHGPKKPNWDTSRNILHAKLWQVVLLSCDIEPDEFYGVAELYTTIRTNPEGEHAREIRKRLRIAEKNLSRKGPLKPSECYIGAIDTFELVEVDLVEFARWAAKLSPPFALPEQFPRLPEPTADGAQETFELAGRWPWGNYETELLRQLEAAARRWWVNYDPSDRTTAPKNEDVVKWLIGKVVPQRVAEIMAQILRADRLPRGPRK